MKEFRVGQSVAIKGIVNHVDTFPISGVYLDVELESVGGDKIITVHGNYVTLLEDLGSFKKTDLVVIPRFIADWLEKCKSESDKYSLSSAIDTNVPSDISNWLSFNKCRNEEVFARAWIEGYEVEKEKLYWVRNKQGNSLLYRLHNNTLGESSGYTPKHQAENMETYAFTKKEIKDYDERYWAFAVPVDEEVE